MVKTLVAWGKRPNIAQIPQVTSYCSETDDRIRALVATVLGKTIADQPSNLEVEKAITYLEELSQDSSSLVRKAAVKSFGNIKSNRAIPTLELALRDADLEVVAIASQILQSYKSWMNPKSKKVDLPPNVALKEQGVS
ncbi:MAG: HEAT repeat domain-containing protein [Halothece sp.]